MKQELLKLQSSIRLFPLRNGVNKTESHFISFLRYDENRIQMPKTRNPYVYFVLDGELRLHTPSGIMDYMPGQYSVSAIDTPIAGDVISFSKENDFLALAIETINTSKWYSVSGINFDGGDSTVYHTNWQTASIDISPYQNQTIKIMFLVYDVGDSSYDSAVVLDNIVCN